jgi:uncharacterized protein
VPAVEGDGAPVRAARAAGGERLHALDILRGLALFGMLLVHFHQRMRLEATGLEDLIGWGIWLFIETKSWGVFAFLFGAGFAVLLRRLEARQASLVPIYLRRLAALAVLGVIADLFLGFRILLAYACWGGVLLIIRRWSTPALLASAVFAACARPVFTLLLALHAFRTGGSPPVRAATALMKAVEEAARQGDYATLFAARWDLFTGTFPRSLPDLLPDVNLALFILGLLAVRHGVLDAPLRHVRLIAGCMAFGAAAWLVSWLPLRHLPSLPVPGLGAPLAFGLGIVQEQWLCLTYIGGVLLLLAHRPVWIERLALVGAAGRMALTNYMLQAVVIDMLASAYGVGLRMRPYAYLAAAVLFFAAEATLSAAWLAHFRFGPLEWIWRTITYARPQPLRRDRGGSHGGWTASRAGA